LSGKRGESLSDDLDDQHWPTVAITSHSIEEGVALPRVPEGKANLEALRMTEAILRSA